jgi:HlyD family secretion protein
VSYTEEELDDQKARTKPERFDISDLTIEDSKRGRPGMGWLRWLALIVVIAALAAGGIYVARERMQPVVETAAARPVTNEPVVLLNASGYVTPRRRATVAAKITARVEQIYVDEGMRVDAGQTLALLDDTDAKVRLTSAEADRQATQATLADLQVNLANAQRDLRRFEELVRAGIQTAQNLDTARTTVDSLRARIASTEEQVKAAEAKVGVARQDLDNTIIRAPFAGMVVSKDAQRGEMVSPISAGGGFTRTGIATVVDMSSLEVEVDVNESYIARVKPGRPVISVLDAYPDWQIPSKVRTVIPTADRQKATVKVRVAFDKLDPRILPDMGVKVSFLGDAPTKPVVTNAMLVPRDAIRDDKGSQAVFLYRDGRAEQRQVRAGEVRGSEREILSGVAAGDQVLVKFPANLRNGQRVKLKEQAK